MDAYPMPRIDDIIDQVGKAKLLASSCSQGRPTKDQFATPFGLYQFTVMPFGLKGALATFQRLMDCVIRGLKSFVSAYLHDIIVFSESFDEHAEHLERILLRLREAGLTAKPQKCTLGTDHCSYFGHIIGGGKVQPELDKLHAVKEYPVPKTKKEVQGFLRLAGYYRRFIANFSAIASPLSDLTKKMEPTAAKWTTSCDKAFNQLKDLLCQSPVLHSPDFNKEFILQTDASERGVGAVLSQLDNEGRDHSIAYFSKKLLPWEERKSTIEKESLAIKLGIHAFKIYLLGKPFQLQTDHCALVWLNNLKNKNFKTDTVEPFSTTL
uniref:Reverse transcriptase domain-containing protein n=1 Tax=Amphimedon queenslandica TaxID=400682 RepID=A0A1X7URL1_AMPQE